MRHAIPILLLTLALGCAGGSITLTPNGKDQPVVTLDPSLYGRGCLWATVEFDPDTGAFSVDMVVAQDGTSDWSVGRELSFVADVVSAAPIVGGERRMDQSREPSAIDGCGQLVEQSREPTVKKAEPSPVTVIVNPMPAGTPVEIGE